MPMKTNIRKYQDMLWKNRFDLFSNLEKFAKTNQLELNLESVKE